MPETTPLLKNGSEGSGYYFLNNGNEGTTPSVRDSDGGEYVEGVPSGAAASDFEPKVIGPKSQVVGASAPKEGILDSFMKWVSKPADAPRNQLKQRKAPIKVEPKVFFANERTFLAWMHISIILAGASVAILAFSGSVENPMSQMYGVIMLPVAIAFIVYSMYQYTRRAYMIRNKHPGPYDDTVGPTVLGVLLMLSIVAQFAIKLYSISK
eukprot:Nitzschia sp. Nitz4//scaffold47_size129522//123259//124089//NITZ4_003572-RA/size129522-snap-gene-0.191-mRNA-1//1//CDS//3329552863//8889//frame0